MKTSIVHSLILIPLVITGSCKTPNKSALKEGFDGRTDPGLFDAKSFPYQKLKQSSFAQGSLKSRPWTDSYWPLKRAGLAWRWIDSRKTFDLDADPDSSTYDSTLNRKLEAAISDAKGYLGKPLADTTALSPAEKIDIALGRTDFPFLMTELASYKQNALDYKDIEWGWMGNCHGWAVASYMEETPTNGVIFTNPSGQQVLFTPGDVRAVLTKAAADYGYTGEEQFMGSRCNDSTRNIPRDNYNRVIDANLGIHKPGGFFSESLPMKIQLNGWNGSDKFGDRSLSVVGRVGPRSSNSPLIWVSAASQIDRQKGIFGVRVYSTRKEHGKLLRNQILVGANDSEVGIFVDENGQPITVNGAPKKDAAAAKAAWRKIAASAPESVKSLSSGIAFKYWKECRDANPGSFHLVLANLLSPGGRGNKPPRSFVMDITRDDQVWNHPVYDYKSVLGQPTPLVVDKVEDPLKSWRAPGTKKIVDVYTTVSFAVEAGPKIYYTPQDDALKQRLFHYTLELDDKDVVIGGEWHPVDPNGLMEIKPLSGKALLDNLKKLAANDSLWENLQHPDFIWGPASGATLGDGKMIPLKFSERLSACSRRPSTTKMKVAGIEIPVTECSL